MRKDANFVLKTVDKDFYNITQNQCDQWKKANDIIENEITQVKHVETTDNTYNDLKRFKELFFTSMKVMKICV